MLAFLSSEPEYNVVLMYNAQRFGMEEGELPLNGHYFGRRDSRGLAAAGAVYNLGSLFFYARGRQALHGMAAYLVESGLDPRFTHGPRNQVELILSQLSRPGRPEPKTMLSEWQLLCGRVAPGIDTSVARPARIDDLPALVEMQQAMHRETFDSEGMDDVSLAGLLGVQVEKGGAFVREAAGMIVSKAEATFVKPHAALLGGVYTIPSHRGEGHCTACVAALCEHLLGEVEAVTLSVERENEAAYRAYRRMGFEKRADWMAVSFPGARGEEKQ